MSADHRDPVDRTVIDGLAESFGGGREGWEFVQELIRTFLEDAPPQLTTLMTAAERSDAERARRAAHTLKSNAATFGAHPLASLAAELESVAVNGRLEAASPLLDRVELEWQRVRGALAAVVGEAPLNSEKET